MNEWAAKVLMFEGDGNYKGAKEYLEKNWKFKDIPASDLARLRDASIPVDIIY